MGDERNCFVDLYVETDPLGTDSEWLCTYVIPLYVINHQCTKKIGILFEVNDGKLLDLQIFIDNNMLPLEGLCHHMNVEGFGEKIVAAHEHEDGSLSIVEV